MTSITVNNLIKKNRNNKTVRSPLFYVGDKYKLMPQLSCLFPKDINNFFDVFGGGGSVSINTEAKKFYLNDIDSKVVELHHFLMKKSANIEEFINEMSILIKKYGLSHSELGPNHKVDELKKEFKKTYFARYNKSGYLQLRLDYNENQARTELLYLLLIYGFNHMIRFNRKGEFNLPVGNVDWNSNVTLALTQYATWVNNNKIILSNLDFKDVLNRKFDHNDFVYLDPPYLITCSEYNKLWNEEQEEKLYQALDKLDERGVKWGVSNLVTDHHGNHNYILERWMKNYHVYRIESNYLSRFDNTIKNTHDVYITNVDMSTIE